MQAGRQSIQVTWSVRQPTFKYKGVGVSRVYKQQGVCMREPTSKVDMQQQQGGGGGVVSDGSCHNIPSTSHTPPNSLISTFRFQSDGRIQNDEAKY